MTDFKLGDRVEVINNIDHIFDSHIGDTGTVVESAQPDTVYGLGWGVISDSDGEVRTFFQGELSELVE